MINIKRLSLVLVLLSLFFSSEVFAQKINQFNTNGKRTGIWRKYYSNKKIRYEGEFKDGKEIGTFKFYDASSTKHPTAVKQFSIVSDSAFVSFYNSKGKLRSKGAMIGKKRVGKWVYFFVKTGKLLAEESYTDGKLDGVLKNYYPNGKVTEETHYKNGLKNGTSKKFADNGTIIEHENYVNGVLSGEAKYYDLKGNLKERGIYKNGRRHGKWDFYIDGEAVPDKKRRKKHAIKNN